MCMCFTVNNVWPVKNDDIVQWKRLKTVISGGHRNFVKGGTEIGNMNNAYHICY